MHLNFLVCAELKKNNLGLLCRKVPITNRIFKMMTFFDKTTFNEMCNLKEAGCGVENDRFDRL